MQSNNLGVNTLRYRMKPIALFLTCIVVTLSGSMAFGKSPASYLGVDVVNMDVPRLPFESDSAHQTKNIKALSKVTTTFRAKECLEDVDRQREALKANAEEANVKAGNSKKIAEKITVQEGFCKKALQLANEIDPPEPLHFPSASLYTVVAGSQLGNKYAQLELGIRFEEGSGGVEENIEKAKEFYRKAAQESGGRIWVYSPPVGSNPGRSIPIDTGPAIYGLPEAKKRLATVEKLGPENLGSEKILNLSACGTYDAKVQDERFPFGRNDANYIYEVKYNLRQMIENMLVKLEECKSSENASLDDFLHNSIKGDPTDIYTPSLGRRIFECKNLRVDHNGEFISKKLCMESEFLEITNLFVDDKKAANLSHKDKDVSYSEIGKKLTDIGFTLVRTEHTNPGHLVMVLVYASDFYSKKHDIIIRLVHSKSISDDKGLLIKGFIIYRKFKG